MADPQTPDVKIDDFPTNKVRPDMVKGEPYPGGQKRDDYLEKTQRDTASYILEPDTGVNTNTRQFLRPWLATPGANAFLFPLGLQGFEYYSDIQLGVHKYIGDNDVDATVIFPDEQHITMSGTFAGATARQSMIYLRDVILQKTNRTKTNDDAAKILTLPGILRAHQYVLCENWRFSHAQDDRFNNIEYSLQFLKVGAFGTDPNWHIEEPTVGPNQQNRATVTVDATHRTLRNLALKAYGSVNFWTSLLFFNRPALAKLTTDMHKLPYIKLPIGMQLYIK